jgi:hypothetical protein
MYLKSLWCFAREYIQRGSSIPLPSYVHIAFTQPRIAHFINKKGDIAITTHVTRRCVEALVVNKLSVDINARTHPANDAELACLSAILGTKSQDLTHSLRYPGAIQFANLLFLMDDVYDTLRWNPTSDVLDEIRQTLTILSQTLPARSDSEMSLDLTDTLMEVSKPGQFDLLS